MIGWYAPPTIVSVEDKSEKDVKSAQDGEAPPPHTEVMNGVSNLGSTPALELDMEELSGSLLVEEHLERAVRVADPPPDPVTRPRSVPPPLPGMSSRPPGPASIPPPLPKPVPPPKHETKSQPDATEIAKTERLEPIDLEVTFSPEEAGTPEAPSEGDEGPASHGPGSETSMVAVPSRVAPPAEAPLPKPAMPRLPDPVPPPLSPLAAAEQAVTLFKAPSFAMPFTPVAENARTVPIERAEILMPDPPARAAVLGGEVELTTLALGVLPPPAIDPSKEARSTSTLPPAGDHRPTRGKGRSVLYTVAALAGTAALAAVGFQLVRSRDRMSAATPLTTVPVPHVTPAAPEPAPPPVSAGPCKLAGEPRVVAPEAVVATGIEARAFGDEIALGFASGDHHASLVHVDPTSLTAKSSTTKPYAAIIRRATPVQSKKGKVSLAIDVDKKGDALRGRRTLDVDPPLQLGVAKQHVAWSPMRHKPAGKLWPLDGDEGVEAPRGAQSGADPTALSITFRSGGSLWLGQAQRSGASLAAQGDLVRLGRQGEMVGAPAVASSDGVVMMAWAERKSADDPWRMRWVRFKAGESPGADHAFMVPAGGPGEQAMAPGLTALSGGRFLLVWTEGPASAHEVRAVTLSSEGATLGEPLRISASGANAGQGQAAVTSNGRGVVAFLQAEGSAFEVVTTPIACTL